MVSKTKLRNLLRRKAIAESIAYVGGFGLPSKMPGTSYGLSARTCGVGSVLAQREGSVCSDCYALRGHYLSPSVEETHERRRASLSNLALWTAHINYILAFLGQHLALSERYHRWHDSGDIQSVEHLAAIVRIAQAHDRWQFWLPTREYGMVAHYLRSRAFPDNLAVRISAPFGGAPPNEAVRALTGLTSTVDHAEPLADGRINQCPAPDQGGQCGTCRACWDHSVGNVNYRHH